MTEMKKSLTQFRKDSGMSKRQYAIWLEIPYTTYLRYEKDVGRASFRDVLEICRKIGVPVTDMECEPAECSVRSQY